MNYKKTKLKNGLRIITVPMKGTETVTVMVMVGVGSRFETEKEAGISHFIEHMMFKGTQKRPNYLDIAEELDSVGGESNAYTGKDRTAYYAKVDAKHIDTALDVISDIFLNSKFDEDEIKKESGAIIQEINMYEDVPMRNVGELFEGLLYWDNPLGRYIAGSKKTVASLKRKNFINYVSRFYLANDTVVCVAGKFNDKSVIRKVEKYFSSMEKGDKPEAKNVEERQEKPSMKIKFKKTDQTHLVLGVRAYPEDHKDRYILKVMSVILGGNMSSRMFSEIREKRGLAYYVHTNVEAYSDCGYIETSVGVEHKNVNLAIQTILGEYKKISIEKVGEKELKKAKEYIKGTAVMHLESSDAVASFFITQEIKRKKIMTQEEIFDKIDKVTPNDIVRVAKNIFVDSKLNLAIIGPHKNKAELQALLKLNSYK